MSAILDLLTGDGVCRLPGVHRVIIVILISPHKNTRTAYNCTQILPLHRLDLEPHLAGVDMLDFEPARCISCRSVRDSDDFGLDNAALHIIADPRVPSARFS